MTEITTALSPLIPAIPAGPLTPASAKAIRAINPAGVILFGRNQGTIAEVRALTDAVRQALGRDVLILIDHEGGRVQRFRSEDWWEAPAPERVARIAEADHASGVRAAYLTALLLARPLAEAGITMNCVPCVDLRFPETAGFLADRTYGSTVEQVTALGRAVCDGTREAGVLPILKHMPGHGRARTDSHHETPVVDALLEDLRDRDLAAFRALNDEPFGMVAHVVFPAIDGEAPVSQSARAVDLLLRREIGFQGLLMSDCITMEALDGSPGERAKACQEAGMDLVIYNEPDFETVLKVDSGLSRLPEEKSSMLGRALDDAWTGPRERLSDRHAHEELLRLMERARV